MRKDLRNAIWLAALAALGLLAAGCGGSGGAGGSSVNQASQGGHMTFTVKFPARSRLVPYQTTEVEVMISGGPTATPTPLWATPAMPSVTTGPLAQGTYTVTATAFTGTQSTPGNAIAQDPPITTPATPAPTFNITNGVTTPVTLTMLTDLSQVSVALAQPPGATPTTITVQNASGHTPSGPLTLIPTLPASVTVTPENGANTLTLFPTPTSNPLKVGTSASDAIQIGTGLVSHLPTAGTLTATSLGFNLSATAVGAGSFTVNYWEPSQPNTPVASIPVTITVGAVTTSVAPASIVANSPAINSKITKVIDVAYNVSQSKPDYLVYAVSNNSYYVVNDLTADPTGSTGLTNVPPAPNLISAGSTSGLYGTNGLFANAALWQWNSGTAGPTLSAPLLDLTTAAGDAQYALDTSNNVSIVANGSSSPLTVLTGASPSFFGVGADLNTSPTVPTNRVVYWVDTTGTLHQTFVNPTAGEPAFGSTPPPNVLAVATAAGCPLTFVIVGTSLEAISQTGTVVGSPIALPPSNSGHPITYSHLAVNVTAAGLVTGAAIGQDSLLNPIYAKF